MRDDLHKGCKLPKPWVDFIKMIIREADRDRCAQQAYYAVIKDLKKGISSKIIEELKQNYQMLLFQGGQLIDPLLFGGRGTVLEQSIMENIEFLSQTKNQSGNVFSEAFANTISDHIDKMKLEIDSHLKVQGISGLIASKAATKILTALKERSAELANHIIAKPNSFAANTKPAKQRVLLEEDISK